MGIVGLLTVYICIRQMYLTGGSRFIRITTEHGTLQADVPKPN